MSKIERKMMAHFIDGHTTGTTAVYNRLGQDLESFDVEMNAEFDSKKNILGASSTQLKGYDPQSSVSPYYADEDDGMFAKLQGIIDSRSTGSACNTTVVEVHLWDETQTTGTFVAYREDATIVIKKYGGDTGGYQIEYDVKYNGNRTKGTFALSTGVFTPDTP